jgi:hypothetical protein
MTDATVQEWEKELKVLLEQIRTHPSQDHTEKRARVVVLQKLIAEQAKG